MFWKRSVAIDYTVRYLNVLLSPDLMNHLAVVTDRELSDVVEEDNAGSSLEANNQFWTNRFIQHQRREGISDEFTLRDMAILYRYAIGDLPVYDVNTGETKNIQSASDLSIP